MKRVISLIAFSVAMQAYAADDDKEGLGIKYTSPNKRFSINPWLRGQFRFSDPFDSDPRNFDDFENEPGDDLEVRRATNGQI
jgi:hypothetical protein